MSLFSENEIEAIRGRSEPLGLTEHGHAALRFVRSPTMASAVREDQQDRHEGVDEVRLLVAVGWPEIDRASRALQHVDRELRRCARAWSLAYENASVEEDESVFGSPDWFLSELESFPGPATVADGRLRILDAAGGDGLEVLLEPEGEVFAVLAQWPRASVAYALSIFGSQGYMSTYQGGVTQRRSPDEESAPMSLHAMQGIRRIVANDDSWSLRLDDYRRYQRRAIADSFDEDAARRSSGVHVTVHRMLPDGSHDVTSAAVA